MYYRKLGRTTLMVSEIGIGGGGIGHVWGATTDEAAREAVTYALDQKINFIDVAPAYGRGRAEENVGIALEGRREFAVVATKVFLTEADLDDIPGAIERSLAGSLERLRTDHLDVFQLHNPISEYRTEIPRSLGLAEVLGPGGVADTLRLLREQHDGVRFVGFTGLGQAEAVRTVIAEGGLDTVQAYYNLLNASAAEPLSPRSTLHDHGQILPFAVEHGLGVIAIRNLAAGALAGRVDRPVPPGSLLERDLRRAERLPAELWEGRSLVQLATRFVLQRPEVASVVPGVKNRAEVEDAIAALGLPPLDAAELAAHRAALADDFGVPEPAPALL